MTLNFNIKKKLGLLTFLFYSSWALASDPSAIAFYSGTFDPPTLAHLQIIQCALGDLEQNLDCKKLGEKIKRIIVSVNKGGVKDTLTSSSERVLMLQKALEKYGNRVEVVASTTKERDAIKVALTKDQTQLYQMIGEDSYLALTPDAFMGSGPNKDLGISKFIVLPRDVEVISTGDARKDVELAEKAKLQNAADALAVQTLTEAHKDSVILFPKLTRYSQLSSTLARKKLELSQSVDGILDPKITALIKDFGFYLKLPAELSELSQNMFTEGFSDFLNDIQNACPNILYLHPERCPVILEQIRSNANITYKEGQSESRWAEKYIEAVLKTITDENEKEVFARNIPYMISATFQGKPYGKLPHLTPVNLNSPTSNMKKNNSSNHSPLIRSKLRELNCSAEQSFQKKSNYNMDIDRYLYDRFPVSLKSFLLKKRDDNQLSLNSLSISNRPLLEIIESFSLDNNIPPTKTETFYFIQTRRGQPHRKLYLGFNSKTKAYRLLAAQVTGDDRHANVFCQLKLSGVFNQFQDLSLESDNDFFRFNQHGNKLILNSNDILIFGFKTAWIEEILKVSKVNWQRTKITDLADSDLELFENNNDKINVTPRLVFARNVFGDEASYVLKKLYEKGLRKVVYLGTAGAIADLQVGSVVIPTSFINQNLKVIPFDQTWAISMSKTFQSSASILIGNKQAWAPHLFDETIDQLIRWRKHGVGSIDVEGYHIAQFHLNHPDLKMANFYIISDQTLGNTTIDQSNSQTNITSNIVHNLIKTLIPQIPQIQ